MFFLSGHGGNGFIMREAARTLVNEYNRDLIIGSASYWEIAKGTFSKLDVKVCHAGAFETSLQLARDEALVNQDAKKNLESGTGDILRYRIIPEKEREVLKFQSLKGRAHFQRHDSFRKFGGVSETPVKASRELGQNALQLITAELAQFFNEYLKHP